MIKTALFLSLYLPQLVFAETQKAATGPISNDYMANLLLSLGLVVGIIFLLAWMVKRFNFIPQQNQGIIKIVSSLSVGSRDRIALIQVGEEQLLIALTPGKITKLHRLETPVEASAVTQESFKSKFNGLMDRQATKKSEPDFGKNNE